MQLTENFILHVTAYFPVVPQDPSGRLLPSVRFPEVTVNGSVRSGQDFHT